MAVTFECLSNPMKSKQPLSHQISQSTPSQNIKDEKNYRVASVEELLEGGDIGIEGVVTDGALID